MLNRIRHLIASRCLSWCVAGIVLVTLQPFIGAHFCQSGLEDEGEFNIRSASASWELEVDVHEHHRPGLETTLFVPSAASIDLPQAFQQGIEGLLALVLLMLPLTVALSLPVLTFDSVVSQRVSYASGAPPPAATPWRRLPPEAAPPFAT